MPIYSYKCGSCGEIFDKLVKAGGNGKVKCVECKSDAQRVFSPVGIIFKGSGFYSTDYKSGSKSAKVADNSSSSSSEKTEDKKLDKVKASSREKSTSSEKRKPGK
jgi:putative FmdB family regulatory protein